jgi:hypothetical protein
MRSYESFRFMRYGTESVITVQGLGLHPLIITASLAEDLDKHVGIASLYTHRCKRLAAHCKTQQCIPFDTISRCYETRFANCLLRSVRTSPSMPLCGGFQG